MNESSFSIEHGDQSKKFKLKCDHRGGILYIIPSEASWVCDDTSFHAHAIEGFFSDLLKISDPQIENLFNKWGMFYRSQKFESKE
tara:strand:+ start:694 stop:948 length:255 start_codon:yes stop_codon:yes gene_type:complete